MKKLLSLLIVVTMLFGVFSYVQVDTKATVSSAYAAIKLTYGSRFPASISISRKSAMLGSYNKVFGVSTKNLKSYKVAQQYKKKNRKNTEYVCVIVKATKKSKVKGIKAKFKKFIKNEKGGISRGYFTKTGARLLANAKVGSKGKCVYLFMLDTAGNKRAISLFKKAV